MEEWQANLVRINLRELIIKTMVDTVLMSSFEANNVLSSEEAERLSAIPVNVDKAYMLYRLILTKRDGFMALIETLHLTKQSGALHVLLSNVPKLLYKNLEVVVGTTNILLADMLTKEQSDSFIAWLENHVDVEICKHLISSKDAQLTLVPITIPEADPLYVPRYLSRRLVLDPKVFNTKAKDTFVFKNITRLNLRNFVGKNAIDSSSEQVFELTCRFILLDHDSHWKELRRSSGFPIHLVNYRDERRQFVVEQTSGGTDLLQKFLQHGTNELRISEIDLVNQERIEKGLCICDLPGMGKTMLLSNLARHIQKKYPTRVVSFIRLSKLAYVLNKKYSELVDFETTKEFLLEWMTTSPVTKHLLRTLLDANLVQMELFFDGLDEVQAHHLNSITQLLIIASEIPNCRIYATSREHLRKELESSTRFIAYDIIPFDEENQIAYLVSIWQQQNSASEESKLYEFAKRGLEVFQETVKCNERKFLGIPLQCRIFAEIYSKLARTYSQIEKRRKIDDRIFVKNVWEMYKLFNEQRLVASECDFQCMTKTHSTNTCSNPCKVKSFYTWAALETIFPNFSIQYSKIVMDFKGIPLSEKLAPGILVKTSKDTSVQFLHRTFAEYLCAEFFACQWQVGLKRRSRNLELMEPALAFLFTHLVQTNLGRGFSTVRGVFSKFESHVEFQHPLPVYFFENFIKSVDMVNYNPVIQHNYLIEKDVSVFLHATCAALKSDYKKLLHIFVRECFERNESTTNEIMSKLTLNCENQRKLLNTAARYSNVSTITILIDLFKKVANINLVDSFESITSQDWSPLEIAVKSTDFAKVCIFLDKFKTDNRGLIYFLVERTNGEDKETVEKREEIGNLLLDKYPALLIERHDNGYLGIFTGPVVAPGISLELAVYLLKKGADIRATCDRKNIISAAAEYMDATDFNMLTEFVIFNKKALDLFGKTDAWDSPISPIFEKVIGLKLETVQMVIEQAHVDVNLAGQVINQNCEMIELINCDILKYIENHVDRDHVDCTKSRRLHQALKLESGELVAYLTALNCTDIEESDSNGLTPILVAAKKPDLKMIDHFFEMSANFLAVDNMGNSILMTYAASCSDEHELHSFVVWVQNKCEANCPILQAFNDLQEPIISEHCLSNLFGMPNDEKETPIFLIYPLLQETFQIFLEYRKSGLGNFLKHPFDINARNKSGITFLHTCVRRQHPVSFVEMVVEMENGLDWRAKDNNHCNITHHCVWRGKHELLKYFVRKGCDVNELDKYGNNALQCSFHFRHYEDLNEETLAVLSGAGLNFDNVNLRGKTALKMLQESKFYDKLSKFEKYFVSNY